MWREKLNASIPLEGGGVRLRQLNTRDAALYCSVCNNREVQTFLGWTPISSKWKAVRQIKQWGMPDSKWFFLVVETQTGAIPIGLGGFRYEDKGPENDTLLAILPDYQKVGNGEEALGLLKALWLDGLGNPQCFASVESENAGAIKLLLAKGFSLLREQDHPTNSNKVRQIYVATTA